MARKDSQDSSISNVSEDEEKNDRAPNVRGLEPGKKEEWAASGKSPYLTL